MDQIIHDEMRVNIRGRVFNVANGIKLVGTRIFVVERAHCLNADSLFLPLLERSSRHLNLLQYLKMKFTSCL